MVVRICSMRSEADPSHKAILSRTFRGNDIKDSNRDAGTIRQFDFHNMEYERTTEELVGQSQPLAASRWFGRRFHDGSSSRVQNRRRSTTRKRIRSSVEFKSLPPVCRDVSPRPAHVSAGTLLLLRGKSYIHILCNENLAELR